MLTWTARRLGGCALLVGRAGTDTVMAGLIPAIHVVPSAPTQHIAPHPC